MNREDVLEAKKQIEQWGIKPTTILMHPDMWKSILDFSLIQFYKMILEEGYSVTSQIELKEGFEFWLSHPNKPDVAKIILRYQDE
jgi:hypothetical protein